MGVRGTKTENPKRAEAKHRLFSFLDPLFSFLEPPPAVVLFGRDERGWPHASRFPGSRGCRA